MASPLIPEQLSRRAMLLICTVVLLYGASLAFQYGLADLKYTAANTLSNGKKPTSTQHDDETSWRNTIRLLADAHALAPAKADYTHALAERYRWGLRREEPLGSLEDAGLMLHAYRTAVAQRPSWAAAWAGLAVERYRYYGADRQVLHALDQAVALGPWESEVVSRVAWLVTQGWSELPRTYQQRLWAYLGDAMADSGFRAMLLRQSRGTVWQAHIEQLQRQVEGAGSAR